MGVNLCQTVISRVKVKFFDLNLLTRVGENETGTFTAGLSQPNHFGLSQP